MSNTNTGGQAFPDKYNMGMTLRDYFAAKAMAQLMLSSPVVQDDARTTASWAYEYADAMLKARQS
jgi:hypothetical protein